MSTHAFHNPLRMHEPPRIIGLVGRARSGKDTVAAMIQEIEPCFHIIRLSASVKRAAAALTGWPLDRFETHEKEMIDPSWGVTPRDIVVRLTHATMDLCGVDVFTRHFWQDYDAGMHGPFVILPDVRYAHDLEWIRARGGLVIKIERPDAPRHAHEDSIDGLRGDVTILNTGDTNNLRRLVLACVLS